MLISKNQAKVVPAPLRPNKMRKECSMKRLTVHFQLFYWNPKSALTKNILLMIIRGTKEHIFYRYCGTLFKLMICQNMEIILVIVHQLPVLTTGADNAVKYDFPQWILI